MRAFVRHGEAPNHVPDMRITVASGQSVDALDSRQRPEAARPRSEASGPIASKGLVWTFAFYNHDAKRATRTNHIGGMRPASPNLAG